MKSKIAVKTLIFGVLAFAKVLSVTFAIKV